LRIVPLGTVLFGTALLFSLLGLFLFVMLNVVVSDALLLEIESPLGTKVSHLICKM